MEGGDDHEGDFDDEKDGNDDDEHHGRAVRVALPFRLLAAGRSEQGGELKMIENDVYTKTLLVTCTPYNLDYSFSHFKKKEHFNHIECARAIF